MHKTSIKMDKVEFKEYHNMSYEDQLQFLEDQIETTRDYKRSNIESIRNWNLSKNTMFLTN